MSITLLQRLSLSLKQILTEDQIEQAMVFENEPLHQPVIEAVCTQFAIEKMDYDSLKQVIQNKALDKFESYNEFGHSFCTTTITAIWLDNKNFFNFLRKNPEYSDEDDSSNYDFLELVNHEQITDTDLCYIFYIYDLDEFILIS